MPMQALQQGKVASGIAATIASRASVQKRRDTEPAPVAAVNASESAHPAPGPEAILSEVFGLSPQLYWLDNPTSTGP
jgi:hypothetical protein